MSTISLVLFAVIAFIIAVWAGVRLMRAVRLGRRGFGVRAEDRRLRDDPRFADAWVQQFRKESPPDRQGPPATG